MKAETSQTGPETPALPTSKPAGPTVELASGCFAVARDEYERVEVNWNMPYSVDNRTRPFEYTCPHCGKKGTTRFPIDPNRPFYCTDCWRKRGGSTSTSAGD